MDRILVQRIKPVEVQYQFSLQADADRLRCSQKTASGIFLPSASTSSPPSEATVLATGPGLRAKDGNLTPVGVKAGDKVLLPQFGGQSLKVGEDVRSLLLVLLSH